VTNDGIKLQKTGAGIVTVKIIHGANEGFFDLQGTTIGIVRRRLRDVFNISSDAIAFVGGEKVIDDRAIHDGESVEFVRSNGIKGLGALLTPEELQDKWQINGNEYEELLNLGLPLLRFQDGSIRHPEFAVDEFMCQHAIQKRPEQSQDSIAERMVTAIELVAARLPNLAGPPMTVEQVAEFSSVSCKTVYRWVSQGRLKPKADGARPLLFERTEVEKTLSCGRRA
jgi:excisionase family DNA binding protein